MEHLWAPWRMQFIDELRKKAGGCVFCEAALPGDDRQRLVLYRGKSCFILMNRFPYNNGHLLIIPYRHTGSLAELTGDEHAEMLRLCANSADVMAKAIEAEGFNCGFNIGKVAGAGITDHVHLHVVPRWLGDTNFMPIIGDTRSMPEYLERTYDRLKPGFEKMAGGANI
ncbi:MAG: HIT domain-containing protein [Pseudomonadota bacterium]